MKFKLVRIEFRDFPDRLNRTVYVRDNIKLREFGMLIVSIIKGEFCHFFYFNKEDTFFYPSNFLEDDLGLGNSLYMNDHTIQDLGKKSLFVYDTGENYGFNIIVDDKEFDFTSLDIYKKSYLGLTNDDIDKYNNSNDITGIIVGGQGLGIWEDNISSLTEYLETGETDYLPWNLNMKSLDEFDKKLDLIEIQKCCELLPDYLEIYSSDITSDLYAGKLDIEPKEVFGACGLNCKSCEAYIATRLNDKQSLKEVANKWSQYNNCTITPRDVKCQGCMTKSEVKSTYCDMCIIKTCAESKKYDGCYKCKRTDTCKHLARMKKHNDIEQNIESLKKYQLKKKVVK